MIKARWCFRFSVIIQCFTEAIYISIFFSFSLSLSLSRSLRFRCQTIEVIPRFLSVRREDLDIKRRAFFKFCTCSQANERMAEGKFFY